MDKSWMYIPNKFSREHIDGVDRFLEFAVSHNHDSSGMIPCPCPNCNNMVFHYISEVKSQQHGDRTNIRKRYMHLTEDILKENPNISTYMAPSFDARQKMVITGVPNLGKEAALVAIKEWGLSISNITHLIFCTTSCGNIPGADVQLAKLLGLRPTVNRFMMYQQSCFGGAAALRMAKDLAENNRGARVLVVCSELITTNFRGPSYTDFNTLFEAAFFGDGAGAVIVGSDPDESLEKPLFQIVSAAQTTIPDTQGVIEGKLGESGLMIQLGKDVPHFMSSNVENALKAAFGPIGIQNWDSLFWVAHPGNHLITEAIELKVGLNQDKLNASKHVLSEYGNMISGTVIFILDEMRKKSIRDGHTTTGEGLDWGVLFGFGPGLTIETIVLHSVPNPAVPS